MKNSLIIVGSAMILSVSIAVAGNITGETLSIYDGVSSPSTIYIDGSGAVGNPNAVYGLHSLAVGKYNYIGPDIARTLAVGEGNFYADGPTQYGGDSIAVGHYNLGGDGDIYKSGVIGSYNTFNYLASVREIKNSLVVGEANSSSITNGFVAGKNNAAVGQHYVLGEGLIAETNARMVVLGQFNAEPVVGQLMVVGNGDSADPNDRKNALEVYSDGKIVIPKRQGDVGMGRFGFTADQ